MSELEIKKEQLSVKLVNWVETGLMTEKQADLVRVAMDTNNTREFDMGVRIALMLPTIKITTV